MVLTPLLVRNTKLSIGYQTVTDAQHEVNKLITNFLVHKNFIQFRYKVKS